MLVTRNERVTIYKPQWTSTAFRIPSEKWHQPTHMSYRPMTCAAALGATMMGVCTNRFIAR